MPYSGTFTSTSCSGILYDNGGPSGNYVAGPDAWFRIEPSADSVTLTFSSFGISGTGRLDIYDDSSFPRVLLHSFSGFVLPNGGNPITISSGEVAIKFTSDIQSVAPGFVMNWSASGSGGTVPSASFSTTFATIDWPVTFSNTSSLADYYWDFGDGLTSTERNPKHTYTSPGVYNAQLIVSSCSGTSDTATKSITIQANPVFSLSVDSLYSSTYCDGLVTASFTIYDSTEVLGYELSSNPNPYIVQEDFELNLGDFELVQGSYPANIPSSFYLSQITGSAAKGSSYLQLNGLSAFYSGQVRFGASTPSEFSFYINPINTSSNTQSVIQLTDGSGTRMFYAILKDALFEVYERQGSSSIHADFALPKGQWSHIELRNIDWALKKYDFYVDDSLIRVGDNFFTSSITSVQNLRLSSGGSSPSNTSFDAMYLVDRSNVKPLIYSPSGGSLTSGDSSRVSISLNTAGMAVGRYEYDILLKTNGSGSDSLLFIPFVVDVGGDGSLSLDKSCIDFDSLHTNVAHHDSIRVYNTGCDTLDVNNITFSRSGITTDVSQLRVSPFDSAYIYVEVFPNSIGPQSDTIYLISNDTTVAVCLRGVGVIAPSIRIDSTAIGVVDTLLGCDDTVHFSFYLYNDGDTNLTWSVNSLPILSDNFDASTSPSSIWQSTSLVDIGPNICYVRSAPNAMEFIVSAGVATTIPFYTSGSDSVTFWAVPEGACGEQGFFDLFVDYTTDGGTTWIRIGSVSETAPLPAYYSFPIQTSGLIQVRLSSQQHHVATGGYFIDDFAIIGAQSAFSFSPANGSITPSDSVLINASIDISGWSDGTYRLPFEINSNDPSSLTVLDTISLTLKLVREPILEIVETGCVDFGLPPDGVAVDSVLIRNAGCDDLILSSFLSTNVDFSAVADTNQIPPGDSTYIFISFTSRRIGIYNDTLTIFTNDTTGQICLTAIGVGSPNFEVTPDSIHDIAMGCQDSIIVPITISNIGGDRTLNFSIDSLHFPSNDSILNVTVLKTGAGPNFAYNQTLRAISEELPEANVIQSSATTAIALTTDLINADVLVIPRQANLGVYEARELGLAMRKYASRGGGILVMASPPSVLSAFGLFSHMQSGSSTGLSNFSSADTNHPVLSGVDLHSFAVDVFRHHYLHITSPNTQVVTTGFDTASHLIAITHFGGGNVAFFGYDFDNYSHLENEIQKAFGNTMNHLIDIAPKDWAYVSSYGADVQPNDSIQLELVMHTDGLPYRMQAGTIGIHTDDPSNLYLSIPFFLEFVPDAGEINLTSGCLVFDSIGVTSSILDSTLLFNSGCDTLHITSFASTTGDFSIESSLPITIAPSDSMKLLIGFRPSAIGVTNDSLYIHSTSDTVGLCVKGKALSLSEKVNDDVQVFPNPSQDLFNISSIQLDQQNWQGVDLEILSAQGNFLFARTADSQQDVQIIDLSQLSPGMYILRIIANSQQVSVRRLLLGN